MARISSYPFDLTIQDNDAWIGSNSTTRATKQFTAKAVAEYLNISGKISISGQMVFKFSTAPIGNGEFIGPANGSAMTSITTIQLSNIDASGQDYVAFMQYLVGNNILISEQNNISNFGHFSITSFGLVAGVYQMALVNIGGNGNLELTKSYDFASFTLVSDSASPFQFNPTSTTGIQSTGNTASGDRSIAMGNGTTASESFSTAMGSNNTASGFTSTAMGIGNTASGSFSIAIGNTTTASGRTSTAIGQGTEASGRASVAMGSNTVASGFASTAMGSNTTAIGDDSTVMGVRATASGYASIAAGQFNVLNTGDNATVYDATNTAFSIGNGTDEGSRSDAFKVLFNGTTTIGTSTPLSGAMLSVFRSIAPTAAVTTVGEFHDFTYTGVVTDQSIYAHIVRNQYTGSNPANLIVGANNIARKTTGSTGTAKDIIGTYSQADNLGSGNISGARGIVAAYGKATFNSDLNSSVNIITGTWGNTQIIGTGTQTISSGAIGGIGQVGINNPNVTINETIGIYSEIRAIKGNLGDTNLLQLNMAGDYSNPDASLSIDNFAYISAQDNFAMPNVTGTSHFIKSSVPLPSSFAGSLISESLNVTALNTAPASATAAGTLGSIRFTADHIYVCVATNTWKRVAIATF